MCTVLLVGEDESLQQTRAAVIRTTGVKTLCSDSLSATSILDEHPCQLVILCHTLSDPIRTDLAEIIHRRSPSTRILLITASNRAYSPEQLSSADAVSSTEPDLLLNCTAMLLGHHRPASRRRDNRSENSLVVRDS